MSRHGRFGWTAGLAAAILMLGTIAVGVAYASQQGGRGGTMAQGMMMREGGPMAMARLYLGQLNLSDEQKQQVKTILGNHQGDFQALRQRATPARRALVDAIATGDEAAIRQRSADLSAVQTDTALLASRIRAEILKILTPEQQQKAQDLLKQAESRVGRGRGGRGPGSGLWH